MDISNDQTPSHNQDASAKAKMSEQGRKALNDIVFGSFAGIVGKVIEYPFDTVKVRLQAQPDHIPLRYAGPLDCFKQSIRSDGFSGLYRGISAPLVGAAVETSSLFFSVCFSFDCSISRVILIKVPYSIELHKIPFV
jgi:mitochondrial ornithine carrier protein